MNTLVATAMLALWTPALAEGWGWLPGLYVFCFVLGLGYTILAAVLGTVGGDIGHDVDASGDFDVGDVGDFDYDLDIDHDIDVSADHADISHGAHLGPFSPLIIAFFLTCFGGMGLLFTKVIDLGALSALPAVGSSFVFAVLAIWAFNSLFSRLEATSQARASDLVGRKAKITISIPEGSGAGQIAYAVKGARYTMTARSEDAVAIAQGQPVVILRIVGQCCFVAPPDDERAEAAMKRRAHADAAASK